MQTFLKIFDGFRQNNSQGIKNSANIYQQILM